MLGRLRVLAVAAVCWPGSEAVVLGALAPSPQQTPGEETSAAGQELGRFHVGRFYVTPLLRIGKVALDTNVFYTPTERTTDLTASVGPGLEVVLPVRGGFRLKGTGHLDYLHFAQTESLRQLTGGGGGGFEWEATRLAVAVDRTYTKRFERPDFEVDRRVTQQGWQTTANVELKGLDRGRRFGIDTDLSAQRIEFARGERFLGADLAANLNRDLYLVGVELRYRLTGKTSLLAGGDYQWDRFLLSSSRDADSNRAFGGFKIESETRLGGRAVGGVRLFRVREPGAPPQIAVPYAEVELRYAVGLKTLLEAGYQRDLSYSAFAVAVGAPIRRNEAFSARLVKVLIGGLELRVFGRLTRFTTDGPVTIVDAEGVTLAAVRDDEVREGGVDLGYWIRSRFRIGVSAEMTRRSSVFSDLGIEGILVGGTLEYKPN